MAISLTKLLACLLIASLTGYSTLSSAQTSCPSPEINKASLIELRAKNWQIDHDEQRNQFALALLPCLAASDSELRDNLSFEALSHWMRNQQLSNTSLEQIRQSLLKQIEATDPTSTSAGFAQPFAVLTLAEVARVDRRTPFLQDDQRQEMVGAAAQFMQNWHDYRGYDETEGWRHGIAHGADWILQLSLNPKLSKEQLQHLLQALAVQIQTQQHFYIYGEPARLMAPVFWIAKSGQFRLSEWQAWFQQFRRPAPEPGHRYTQAELMRRHNLSAFLLALYYSVREANDAQLKQHFLPALKESLQELR